MARSRLLLLLAFTTLLFPAVGWAGQRSGLMLPNLVPLPPGQVMGPRTGLLDDFGYGYPVPLIVNGCLPDETVRKGALRCLRYPTIVSNRGEGALEIAYRIEAPAPGAYQRIYRNDGSSKTRFAVASEFHPTHAHFHFKNFYVAALWESDARGKRVGNKPVATNEKSGFCPEDGGGPGGGDGYSCIGDYRSDGGTVAQIVGISPGRSDAYRMHIPDQFIEISDIGDGLYLLEITIDPDDRIVESNERDNRACALIRLQGEEASLLRTFSRC